MEKNSKIYVAGHRGLVGSAILRKLGWKYTIDIDDGIRMTYKDFLNKT
jgi:nucleoside-diphosphate-sugar epimerase